MKRALDYCVRTAALNYFVAGFCVASALRDAWPLRGLDLALACLCSALVWVKWPL